MDDYCQLESIYVGKVEKQYGFETAINKVQIKEPIYLSFQGLVGDECADQRHHGGVERALHQYPIEHYDYWNKKYPAIKQRYAPGMGENLSSLGMTEFNVCIGDQYQWGTAVIEVSQPRSPCFKLNKRWGVACLSVEMQQMSLCGWLYRVRKEGIVSIEEPLKLIHREPHAMSIREVCDVFYGDPLSLIGLEKLKQQSKLSDSWRIKVLQRIESKTVENWSYRLLGRDAMAETT